MLFSIRRLLSAGPSHQYVTNFQLHGQAQNVLVEQFVPEEYNKYRSTLMYFLQTIWESVFVFGQIYSFYYLGSLWQSKDYTWAGIIIGPCFLHIFMLIIYIYQNATACFLRNRLLPFYNPFKSFALLFQMVVWFFQNFFSILNQVIVTIWKPIGYVLEKLFDGFSRFFKVIFEGLGRLFMLIFDGLAYILTQIFNGVSSFLAVVFKGLSIVIEAIALGLMFILKKLWACLSKSTKFTAELILKFFESILTVFQHGVSFYDTCLFKTTQMLVSCNIIGEIILIPVGLLWMFWPVLLSYEYQQNYVGYIPTTIVSLILTFRGFAIIQKASHKHRG